MNKKSKRIIINIGLFIFALMLLVLKVRADSGFDVDFGGYTTASIKKGIFKHIELSADDVTVNEAICILRMWLATEFEGGRHKERIDLIQEIENENMK